MQPPCQGSKEDGRTVHEEAWRDPHHLDGGGLIEGSSIRMADVSFVDN